MLKCIGVNNQIKTLIRIGNSVHVNLWIFAKFIVGKFPQGWCKVSSFVNFKHRIKSCIARIGKIAQCFDCPDVMVNGIGQRYRSQIRAATDARFTLLPIYILSLMRGQLPFINQTIPQNCLTLELFTTADGTFHIIDFL